MGFKWVCRCCSKTRYLYASDLYLGKKGKTGLGLGETFALDLCKKLENAQCMLYFDNIFNSPALVEKVFDRGIYCLSAVRSDRKNKTIMKKDNDTKRGDIDFQYANDVVAVKWFDNRKVIIVGTCLEK